MKKIIEITSLKELMEISMAAAVAGTPVNTTTPKYNEEEPNMRQEIQTEMLMRQYIRKKIKKQIAEQNTQEQQLRLAIRGLIKEAKENANPHPNTGINKLRDAFRKAKPTLKAKYQQLTSTAEQRETFTAHMLRAFVRLFDELDALQAQGDIESSLKDIESSAGSLGTETSLAPPPEDQGAEEIEDEIEDMLKEVLKEVQLSLEEEEIDIVSDDEKAAEEKEQERKKSQAQKDYEKKKETETEKVEFGGELEGDTTGRNQAFDAFRLVQSYFSDAYLDLANSDDQQMYRDWCLFNLKLLFKNFEESLPQAPEEPNIDDPEGI